MRSEAATTPAVTASRRGSVSPRSSVSTVAVIPAFNEAASIGALLAELREVDPTIALVVVDDGSTDSTARQAAAAGAHVVRLPFNLGIGGAVQTGFKSALDQGFDLAVRLDGDGQHDPRDIARLVEPVLAGRADICVGSRFAAGTKEHPSRVRLFGIRLLARVVSLLVRQRVTDTTSGFQALNRKALALFAADYPHDYPEVEATVMVFRHRLRLVEVLVTMRERAEGSSSITTLRSAYYMIKVLLALFVGLFRRPLPVPEEEQ